MKPNFALNFTDDGITLLHRTKRGWAEVGSTPFAVDDLPAELAKLRDARRAGGCRPCRRQGSRRRRGRMATG